MIDKPPYEASENTDSPKKSDNGSGAFTNLDEVMDDLKEEMFNLTESSHDKIKTNVYPSEPVVGTKLDDNTEGALMSNADSKVDAGDTPAILLIVLHNPECLWSSQKTSFNITWA